MSTDLTRGPATVALRPNIPSPPPASVIVERRLLGLLRNCNSMPFIFVGAGLSRRYLKSEGWEDLLRLFASYAKPEVPLAYQLYKEPYRGVLNPLDYLPHIASAIEVDFNRVWFTEPQWKESRDKNTKLAESGISPFKIVLADHFSSMEIKDITDSERSELELLKEMHQKSVFGVITTNYDYLFEGLFPDFKVFIGQEELLFSNPQYIREIYKIHGCAKSPNSIVINQNDYAQFAKNKAYLAAKLLTMFVEHPIVFLGYSMNDSNMEQIFKSIVDCLSQENLSKLKNRFIFIEYEKNKSIPEISSFEKTFEGSKIIQMTKITTDSFIPIFNAIANNKSTYPIHILQRLKEDVYNLVHDTDSRTNIMVKDFDSIKENEPFEVVIGVGTPAGFGVNGYKLPDLDSVYYDIILDNGGFNPNHMVKHALSSLLIQHSNSVPIYKYLALCDGEDIPREVSRCINKTFNTFICKTLKDRKERGHKKYFTVNDVVHNVEYPHVLIDLALLDKNEINPDDLKTELAKLLENHLDIFKGKERSNIRRLIKIYDWLVYSQK